MIICHIKHLEQRATSRGYSMADIEPCIVAREGDTITVDESHQAYPRKPLGLGGMIKAGLSAIGITEERVSKAIGKPCGCGKRAENLDKLGYKLGIGKPPSLP
jgi:hypothetical protein